MKRLIYIILLLIVTVSVNGQVNLLSGNLQITGFPSSLPSSKFLVSGNFNDTKGLFYASDITTGMWMWKGNAYYVIDSIYSVAGTAITFRVTDPNATGFISGGSAGVMELSANGIPAVPPTGDSNSSYMTPSDYSALLSYISSLIGTGSGSGSSSVALNKTAHGFSQGQPIYWDGDSWEIPTNDTLIATFVVVDSTTANTFTAAASGTFDTDIADGFYYQNGGTYSLTPDTIETPLFVVADGKMTINPILGYDLLATEDLPQTYNIATYSDTSTISTPNENSIALIGSSPYDSIAVFGTSWNLVVGGEDTNILTSSGSATGSQSWNLFYYYLTLNGNTKSNLLYVGENGIGVGTNDLSATRFHVKTDTNDIATFRFGNATSGGRAQIRAYAESSLKYGALTYYGANSASSGATGPNMAILSSTGSDGIKIIAQESTGNIYFGTGGIGNANQRGIINSSGNWGFGTVSPQRNFHFNYTTTLTSTIEYTRKQLQSSGTVGPGFGYGEEIYVEDGSNNHDLVAAEVFEVVSSTNGTEKVKYRLSLINSGVVDTAFSVEEDGDIVIEKGIKDSNNSLGSVNQVLTTDGSVVLWQDAINFDSINVTDTISPFHTGFYKLNGNLGAFTLLLDTSGVLPGTTITIKAYNVAVNNVTIDSSSGGFIDVDSDLTTAQSTIILNTTSAKNLTYDGQDWHIH